MSLLPNANQVIQFGGHSSGTAFPNFTIALSDYAKMKTLVGSANVAVAGNRYGFANMCSGAGGLYQVTAAKTLVIAGCYLASGSTAGILQFQFGYSTATFTQGQAGATTGEVLYAATTTVANDGWNPPWDASSKGVFFHLPMTFPANSFPLWRTANAVLMGLTLYGIEM